MFIAKFLYKQLSTAKRLQNSTLKSNEKESNSFIFEPVHMPIGKNSLNTEPGCLLLANTKLWANGYLSFPVEIGNFNVKQDGVRVLSYPKSRTTWIQNIVSQLKHEIDVKQERITITGRWNFAKQPGGAKKGVLFKLGNSMERIDKETSPRIIKSLKLYLFLEDKNWYAPSHS